MSSKRGDGGNSRGGIEDWPVLVILAIEEIGSLLEDMMAVSLWADCDREVLLRSWKQRAKRKNLCGGSERRKKNAQLFDLSGGFQFGEGKE